MMKIWHDETAAGMDSRVDWKSFNAGLNFVGDVDEVRAVFDLKIENF